MERAALQALSRNNSQLGGGNMLRWALAFFVIAIIAAVFGFAGIAVAAAGIAKLLFYLFLILFLVALVGGLVRRA
jgi:uncharacterized membrane protein YtjA (UPF0391 family)